MTAILDREIKAYFQSPLGYVFVGVMFLFTGYFFFAYNLYGNTSDMRYIFSMLFTVVLFVTPILTMRLMSEDRKLKTDQLLLTAPLSKTGLVLGKYLAAVCVYLLSLMGTMVVAVVIAWVGKPEWPVIFGHFTGIFLLGCALIAICLFLSSLTESQVLAAIGGFAVSFLLMLVDTIAPVVPFKLVSALLVSVSFQNRYGAFTLGVLQPSDVLFFFSVIAFFLSLTVMALERRRFGRSKGYFTVLAAILLAILLLLNLVVGLVSQRMDLSLDLTSQKLFEISEESRQLAQAIDKNVVIYVLAKESDFTGSSTYMAQANTMIRQYGKYGGSIAVEYVNYAADPTFAARFPNITMSHGDILIVSGERHQVVKTQELFSYTYTASGQPAIAASRADQVIASALLNVTSDELIQVSVLTGHGEYTMGSFEALLENNSFIIKKQNLATEDIDKNSQLTVLTAPHNDLSDEAIEKLSDFLYNGGAYGKTLLYAADAEQAPLPNLESFLRDWGVDVGDGAVFETSSSRVYNYHPFYAVADYAEETFTVALRDLRTPMLMPVSRPLSVLYEYRNDYSVKVLLQFGASSAVRPSDADDSFTQEQAEVRGPIPAMALASYTLYDKSTGLVDKQSNILVSGSAGMMDSYAVDNSSFANSQYLVNVLNLLCGKDEAIVIQSKTITGKELSLTTAQANWTGLVFAVFLPGLIMAAGIAVWLYRRYK